MTTRTMTTRLFLLLVLLTACTQRCWGADVIGVVHDSITGAPLSGVAVIAWETSDTVFTDGSGQYHLTNVPTDYLTLVIGNSGYTPALHLISSCLCPSQGDMNGDGFIDSIDLAILINVLFFGQADTQDVTCPTWRGDFNSDGQADSVDLGYIIDYAFFGGIPPTDPCLP